MGIALDRVVEVDLYPQAVQPLAEGVRRPLSGILGDNHAAHIQPLLPEGVDETEHVLVIGDAQVPPDLILLDGGGVDGNNHFHRLPQLQQHTDFAVRGEAGQHPRRMMVIKQLSAELQIQLAAKLGDPLPNMGRLSLQIPLVVKSDVLSHNSV